MHKKFCIFGKCFTAAGILKKATGFMSRLLKPVMKLFNAIINPIKRMFERVLKPLFAPLFAKLKFPKLPFLPALPSFLKPAPKPTGRRGLRPPPGFNTLSMYKTCAFNLDWVKASGTNLCNCCLTGMMNPRKPTASILIAVFRTKICSLMSVGMKQAELLSPQPVTCWDPSKSKMQAWALTAKAAARPPAIPPGKPTDGSKTVKVTPPKRIEQKLKAKVKVQAEKKKLAVARAAVKHPNAAAKQAAAKQAAKKPAAASSTTTAAATDAKVQKAYIAGYVHAAKDAANPK
jgi:hypothetical protein